MTITYELDLNTFEGWSGAENTLKRIINEDKVDSCEALLDELYPDGMTETKLNDILRFEADWLFECLGIRTEEQIKSELEEKREELSDLMSDFEDDAEGLSEEERKELYEDSYESDIEDLKEEISELEEELENI